MKKSFLLPCLIVALACPVAAFAQDKTDPGKSGTVKTPNPAGVQHQFSGAITAVSREEKTITINDGAQTSHKLQIGDTTKMKRGDRDGTWEDLKVGAKVDGTCSGGEEMSHAETINING